MKTLGVRQHALLCEALRRFSRFVMGAYQRESTIENLRRYWTGLGYKSDYNPVQGKYMILATDGQKRCLCWWVLTEEGALIVQEWLKQGYTYADIEMGNFPSSIIGE